MTPCAILHRLGQLAAVAWALIFPDRELAAILRSVADARRAR